MAITIQTPTGFTTPSPKGKKMGTFFSPFKSFLTKIIVARRVNAMNITRYYLNNYDNETLNTLGFSEAEIANICTMKKTVGFPY